jgi:hypothetical protein
MVCLIDSFSIAMVRHNASYNLEKPVTALRGVVSSALHHAASLENLGLLCQNRATDMSRISNATVWARQRVVEDWGVNAVDQQAD